MAIGLIILAAIPAYFAAGAALFVGAGWLMALAVLVGTGVCGALFLATLRVVLANTPSKTPTLSLS